MKKIVQEYKLSDNLEVMRRINRVKPVTETSTLQRSPSRESLDKNSINGEYNSYPSDNENNDSEANSGTISFWQIIY